MRRGDRPPQILADQLTPSQSRMGALCPPHYNSSPGFSDLPTALFCVCMRHLLLSLYCTAALPPHNGVKFFQKSNSHFYMATTQSSNATSENSWPQTPKLMRCRVLQRRKGNRLLMFVTTKKHWLAKPHFRRFFLLSYAAFKMFPIFLLLIHFTKQYFDLINWWKLDHIYHHSHQPKKMSFQQIKNTKNDSFLSRKSPNFLYIWFDYTVLYFLINILKLR